MEADLRLPEDDQERLLKLLHHMVVLTYIGMPSKADLGKGVKPIPQAASGFVIEVDGSTFWITAGHVLRDIADAKNRGVTIQRARLFDRWKHGGIVAGDDGVPIELGTDSEFAIYDETRGIDCGGIRLSKNHRALLDKVDIEILTERSWTDWNGVPDNAKDLAILGVPEETTSSEVQMSGGKATVRGEVTPVVAPAEHLVTPPSEWMKEHPRIIAKLRDDLVPENPKEGYALTNFVGMSGGPVFLVFRNPLGEGEYRLLGIQSTWNGASRTIAAHPITTVVAALRHAIQKGKDSDAM